MSMMDFQSALAGAPPGAGAPPSDIGAPPPDLGAPPPDVDVAPDTETADYATSLEALDGAEDALHSFIQLDPDEADRAEATKALQIVIKLKASNQQAASDGSLSSLQRALQGGPAGNAGPLAEAAAGAPYG